MNGKEKPVDFVGYMSALSGCADTMRALSMDHCGKVKDFSCLQDLHNLE